MNPSSETPNARNVPTSKRSRQVPSKFRDYVLEEQAGDDLSSPFDDVSVYDGSEHRSKPAACIIHSVAGVMKKAPISGIEGVSNGFIRVFTIIRPFIHSN